jgi:hypothetical protein
MSKVLLEMSMSLDGYVTSPDVTAQEPMGRGGERLHATKRRNRCGDHDPEGRRRVHNRSRYVDVPAVQAAAY